MCGITGIVDLRERRDINRRLLVDMNDRQSHRGPDGSGVHLEPGVGLAHRRLSIIDLEGGLQPMFNEDRSVVVTFNGEIYEFSELRAELQRFGHTFQTRSDTEVIVHAWEQWGTDCLERLGGMFAFAIWDRNRDCVFIARDRFGKKPVYYSLLPSGFLIFASELKSLLVHPELNKEIEPTAVEDYMTFGYVPDPKSIFKSVRKLEPGHFLLATRGDSAPTTKQYWNIRFEQRVNGADEGEVSAELYRRFKTAVEKRLLAEVPLGAFLSGGVDSSGVVTAMAEVSAQPVRTCSISFSDPRYNEAAYAEQVARKLRTNHQVEQVDADDFSIVDKITEIYDEPFADSSAIPTYRVCQLARKHVTVALSGDGGDEIFAGYRRYRWHMNEERVRSRLPPALRRIAFGMAGALYPKMDWAPRVLRAKSTLQGIAKDSAEAYLHSVSILPGDLHGALLSDGFKRKLQGYTAKEVFDRHVATCDTDDPLSLIQYLDIKTYLPGDILVKVDRASMAHSLEVRVPILDADFASWAASLPSALKLKNGEGKHIFKKALRGHVDDNILYRDKMGFAVPLASWFRGPLRSTVEDRLTQGTILECGIFDNDRVRSIAEQHMRGTRDHSAPIWALLVFANFLRTHS
jgi:asparagine synthase (glutamine-hydrolysing)